MIASIGEVGSGAEGAKERMQELQDILLEWKNLRDDLEKKHV